MSANTTIDETGKSNMPHSVITKVIRACPRRVTQFILMLCLLPVIQVHAATAVVPVYPSPPPPPPPPPFTMTFTDPIQDLSVKVWGGNVVIRRGLLDGEWYPNLDWLPIKVTYDSLDNSVKSLTRGRTDYNRIAPGVFQDALYNTIRQTTTGYRWNNRTNNWIEYNPAGEIKSFGNRNGTVATFRYGGAPAPVSPDMWTIGVPVTPSEGRIIGVYDHFGTQVLWFDYVARTNFEGKYNFVSIRDSANRTVNYNWTPTPNGMNLDVLDVNGNTWHYVLSGIISGGVTGNFGPIPAGVNSSTLGTGLNITDPEAHTTSRRWYSNGGMAVITYPDNSQEYTLQDYDAAAKTFYRREISVGGKITETWSGLTQDVTRGDYLRQDINGVTVSKQSVDTAARITTYTDARGLNTAVTKNQWDNITRVVYPDGSSVSTQYDPTYNNITQYSDENGVVTQYSYDAKGNLLKIVEAVGLPEQRTTLYINDADGQRKSMTRKGDANTPDATTLYDYDSNGNVIKITDAEGGITQFTSYDVMGNALTRIDPRGKVWKQSFDNTGRLLVSTDPLNRTSTITYDKAGLPASIIDPVGNISILGFDAAGKLLTVTDPYGARTTLTYDSANNPNLVTDSENHTQKLEYDLDGRPTKQTDGNNNITQFIYGDQASGLNRLLTKVIYPTLSQEYNYDQRDRITQGTNSASGTALPLDGSNVQVTKVQYGTTGKPTVVTDPANRNSGTSYNGLGQVTQTTDQASGITRYGYDARGNLTSVTDAKGNTHRFEYDKLDRMVKEIRPLGQTIAYAYDANRNLVKVTDPLGQIKKYTYDDVNRRKQDDHYLNAASLISNNSIKSIIYEYNNLDRLSGYADGNTTATYTYDTKQLRQTGQSVNYGSFSLATNTSYNSLEQKSSITYPDGAQYSYTYDTNNQLSSVNLPTGFGSITFNSYTWTVPAQITLPGGTVRNQQYDGLLRLKDIAVKDPGQSSVLSYQYNYDLTSNIVAKTTEAGSTSYGYDTLDHLTSATYTNQTPPQSNETYTYDGVDNRITDSKTAAATWEYDANNQLITAGTISYTYDDNGNTLSQTDSANSANTRNYVYDTDNRLIEVRNVSNTLIAAYSYDPFSRRLSKDAGTSKTYYFYNEEGLIAEADATGVLTKSYGYAPGSTYSTNPLWQKSGNAYYTYQNDHLGTPQKLLSQSGAVVWSATYDAFGKAVVDPASTITNNLRFPGQYYDAETNLHYNWMRFYEPISGRYVTSDPIGLEGGFNMYTYVVSNPLNLYDPMGLFLVTFNYGRGPYDSYTVGWNGSWLPGFYGQTGTNGDGIGKNIDFGLYKYKYGKHPMLPSPGQVPYPALNLYRPFETDPAKSRKLPGTDRNGKKLTVDGANFHKGYHQPGGGSGSDGCHVVYHDKWNKFIGNFKPGDEGYYLYLKSDSIPMMILCPACYLYANVKKMFEK